MEEVMSTEEFMQAERELAAFPIEEWEPVEKTEEEFASICREIARGCEAEGYPSHGENYELRVEEARRRYWGGEY